MRSLYLLLSINVDHPRLIKAEIIPDGNLIWYHSISIVSKINALLVLPNSFAPSLSLSIRYQNSDTSVSFGNNIPVPSASSEPVFALSPLPALPSNTLSPTRTLTTNKTYTLILSDPDATSHSDPVKAQMCHWIITGLTLQSLNSTEGLEGGEGTIYALDMRSSRSHLTFSTIRGPNGISDADGIEEILKYLSPSPPPKTGRHRYVFVLLEPEASDGKRRKKLKKPKDRPHWGYKKQGQGVMDWAADNDLIPVGANFFYAQHKKQ